MEAPIRAPTIHISSEPSALPGAQIMRAISKCQTLRGFFLRGAHGAGIDPDGGREPGHRQEWNTGMPKNPFTTGNISNHHSHAYPTRHSGFPPGVGPIGHFRRGDMANDATSQTGNSNQGHTHAVIGGDTETRPVNKAVNYIIKY